MAPIASTAAALCFLLLLAATVSNAALANSSSNSSSHSNAAAASCPDQPVNLAALSSSSSAPPTTCRVLIVGGGAAGMFSAYTLRELGSGVCVVERKTVWGGKLQSLSAGNSTDTDSPDNAGIGTAGLWIHGEQTDVRCLANQLNVTLEESHDDTLINARGQWTRGGAEGLLTTQNGSYTAPAFNLTDMDGDTDDLQDRMWEFLLGMKATNPLTGATPSPHPAKSCASYRSMGHYINTTLGLEAYAFLIADMPEPGNLQFPVDVCAWIQSEIDERTIRSKITTQFIAHGGWHGIIERAGAVAAAAGVRFFLDSPIACISSIAGNATAASALHVTAADGTTSNRNSSYQFVATGPGGVSGRVFIAEHLIFASGPLDVRKLGGNVGRRLAAAPEAASIRPVEVAVYDAFYPQRFWEDYMVHRYGNMPVRTDANCLVFSEFPGHTYFRVKNATRPVYATDLRCIAFWRQLHAASGMPGIRNYVQSSLQGLFPLQEVPAPYLDTFVVHADGWHLMDYGASQRNVSIASIYSWAASPLGDHANLCLAGEAYYGISYGWTAGAWRTAAHCIKQRFAGVLSGAALAAVEYVSSGCNGRARFPNEIVLPRNASMPGLNPATGKVLPTVE
uniref:FAD-dependent oxidoreductase 2 FAD-binding domain-containing protein n=1 Tax=Tetradesmus obliquus TaxID=3088 RepID=A0A383V4I9_TETOB|eukprot:jgi/Sobl393_1/7726/SZX59494.1